MTARLDTAALRAKGEELLDALADAASDRESATHDLSSRRERENAYASWQEAREALRQHHATLCDEVDSLRRENERIYHIVDEAAKGQEAFDGLIDRLCRELTPRGGSDDR